VIVMTKQHNILARATVALAIAIGVLASGCAGCPDANADFSRADFIMGPRAGVRVGTPAGVRATYTVNPGPPIHLLLGDSIQVGIGVGDAADHTSPIPNALVQYLTHYAIGVGPPPTFFDYPSANTLGNLNLYAASGGQSLGPEISMGPVIAAAQSSAIFVKTAVSGSTLATEWNPTGTYPASGSRNLFNIAITQAQTIAVQTGGFVKVAHVILGTNDSLDATNATNFGTNVTAFAAALRSVFGSSLKIVWVLVNSNTTNPHVTDVRSGLLSAAAGDAQMAVVQYDDCALLGDGLHPTTESYATLGQRMGAAALDLQGITRKQMVTFGATGWGVSWGPGASGSGALSLHSYGGARANGREYLVVTTGIVAGTIPVPSVANGNTWSQVGSTVASTSSGVTEQLAVFTRLVSSTDLTNNGGHTAVTTVTPTTTARHAAKIFYVEGPGLTQTTDASLATSPNTFDTGPTTMAAVTATQADLTLLFTGGYCGASGTMSATNGTLANYVQLQDAPYVIVTDREIVDAFGGTGTGSSGTWAVSSSNNMVKLGLAVAVKP
jgi:hypothetical protein